MSLARQISTAGKVLLSQGGRAFLVRSSQVGKESFTRTLHSASDAIVSLLGNKVHLDSCVLHVENPIISKQAKYELLSNYYEVQERKAVKAFLDPRLPVVELGGSAGLVACVTNKRLTKPNKHIVVEANALIVPTLRHNRSVNHCDFEILHAALGYGSDVVHFIQDTNYLGSRVGSVGSTTSVKAVTLQGLQNTYSFNTFSLICDIEGGEEELLRHEPHILQKHVHTLIMELHPYFSGWPKVHSLIGEIEALGFKRLSSEVDVFCWRNQNLEAPAASQELH